MRRSARTLDADHRGGQAGTEPVILAFRDVLMLSRGFLGSSSLRLSSPAIVVVEFLWSSVSWRQSRPLAVELDAGELRLGIRGPTEIAAPIVSSNVGSRLMPTFIPCSSSDHRAECRGQPRGEREDQGATLLRVA
jgi:hypothetical protein